jgi:hypothetical protein
MLDPGSRVGQFIFSVIQQWLQTQTGSAQMGDSACIFLVIKAFLLLVSPMKVRVRWQATSSPNTRPSATLR